MTRREKGTGTLRKVNKEKNGKTYTYWEGQITIGVDPGTGKQKRKTFTGKTQKEVREKMQAAAVSVNEGTYFEPTKLTVREWFDLWLAEYCGDKKYFTIDQYSSYGRNHICSNLGAIKLSALSSIHIQKFYNKLGSEVSEKTGKPLSAKSIRNIHGILSKCLNVAVEQGLIRSNPCERVTVPKVIKTEIEPLTEEEQKAFLKAIKNHQYCSIFTTMLFSGMRISEAIGLTWDCIDFQRGTMKIYRQLQKRLAKDGGYTFAPLKNSKTRIIQLSPYVLSLLEKQQKQQILDRFSAGDLWQGFADLEEQKTAFVFTDKTGQHLKQDTVRTAFKEVCKEIGTPESRVHDLRHTFAVNSLQSGDDFKTVSESLGHATAAFTLDVYGHVSDEMRKQHAQRQQAYIEKCLGL